MAAIPKATQAHLGYTDEQVANLKQNQINYINGIREHIKYNLVAEVVESKNCGWQAKVGDRIVLRGLGGLVPADCTNKEGFCIWALAALLPYSMIMLDRASSGMDPNESVFKRTTCGDTGVEHCGWGRIVMEISAEKWSA